MNFESCVHCRNDTSVRPLLAAPEARITVSPPAARLPPQLPQTTSDGAITERTAQVDSTFFDDYTNNFNFLVEIKALLDNFMPKNPRGCETEWYKMSALIHEKIWLDKTTYNDAEKNYYESISKAQNPHGGAALIGNSSLASEVAKARQHIKNSLECMDSVATLAGVPNTELFNKLNNLEKENVDLKKAIDDLRKLVLGLQARVDSLETKAPKSVQPVAPAQSQQAADKEDSDDGVDLFGSDDEEESAEAAKLREERLAAYNAKKAKKPVLIAKSNIILDVKPWDDETDMAEMEKAVRLINTDGLLWGAAKLVPLAFGIHKLQISCVVEDDKVSVDWLVEEIEKIEDFVQSVDIAAFNKV
ncbi:Elongation factor 1-delta [Papilio machaon]|uniref:Elongation factor 1-delta n=1 Tax=Papilio machaon TaxID=76193 RepID=A0A194RH23_PAPMA|nr:Elongation factor 1-delta [Papilio machaon]